jgi:tuberous sclerosis protein 2
MCASLTVGYKQPFIFLRSPVAKFLLEGGQAQSWLLGDSIITITTSGGARVGPSGLCEKCVGLVRSVAGSSFTDEKSAANRRRHKSEAVIKLDSSLPSLKPLLSQDDIGLHRRHGVCQLPPEIQDVSLDTVNSDSVDAKRKAVDSVLIGWCYVTVFFM